MRGAGVLRVGACTAIGQDLGVVTSNHSMRHANMQFTLAADLGLGELHEPADVEIGPGCWIGDRVLLMPGCRLGPGCVVAGGAVLPGKSYPAFGVVVGAGRVLRRRFAADVCELLEETAWWGWSRERMIANRDFFAADLSAMPVDVLRGLLV